MDIRLGDRVPDFTAETTHGTISFREWLGASWGVLFSHLEDFTPRCTSDLDTIAHVKCEFAERDTKVIGISVEGNEHLGPCEDINGTQEFPFPMIADPDRKVSHLYGMIHPIGGDTALVRSVFVVGPDQTLKLIHAYPQSKGRSFDEVLRAIDSLQLAAEGSPRRSRRTGFSMSVARNRAVPSALGSPRL